MKPINVFSAFDGASMSQLALQRANIPVNNYFSSEIDKYAITIAQKNFPNTIQLGGIEDVSFFGIPKIDLLIGGSPCQGFSFAGKQLNFNDPRSKLFFEFVRLKDELNPKYFFLENVNMKKKYQDVISNILGVEPIKVNSALVSAQRRVRLYWTNIPGFIMPEDKGMILENIIEYGYVDRLKSHCLDASYGKGGDLNKYFNKSRRQLVFLNEKELNRAVLKYKGKVWRSGNRMGNMSFPDKVNKKSKSVCATVIKGSRETIHISDKKGIRILLPIEAERLQTLPDNYTEGVSNTQRYKMIGNGFNVDTIVEFVKHIK